MADPEDDVRSALGGSYVGAARRYPRVIGVGRSIQEGLGADGGVPELLHGTAGGVVGV